VLKTASPSVLTEPGGEVTFEVSIYNTSPDVSVTVDSLLDDVYGDLNGQGTCAAPIVLQPSGTAGDAYSCSFTAAVTGNSGDTEIDTVTASGIDENANLVSDQDSASVEIRQVPVTGVPVPLFSAVGFAILSLLVGIIGFHASRPRGRRK
jgi:hypothetical protein